MRVKIPKLLADNMVWLWGRQSALKQDMKSTNPKRKIMDVEKLDWYPKLTEV